MDFEDPNKKKKIYSSFDDNATIKRSLGAEGRHDFAPKNRKPRFQGTSSPEVRSSMTIGRPVTREQLPGIRKKGNISIFLFLLGIVAVGVFAVRPEKIETLKSLLSRYITINTKSISTPLAPTPESANTTGYVFNYSLFGPQAVATCKRSCLITRSEGCGVSCDKLGLTSFPYEQLRENINPLRDVARVIYLCQEGSKSSFPQSSNLEEWDKNFDSGSKQVSKILDRNQSASIALLRLQSTQLEKLLYELQSPPQRISEYELKEHQTKELYRALCVAYSINLARIGLSIGLQQDERDIKHYYSEFIAGAIEKLEEIFARIKTPEGDGAI